MPNLWLGGTWLFTLPLAHYTTRFLICLNCCRKLSSGYIWSIYFLPMFQNLEYVLLHVFEGLEHVFVVGIFCWFISSFVKSWSLETVFVGSSMLAFKTGA